MKKESKDNITLQEIGKEIVSLKINDIKANIYNYDYMRIYYKFS